MRFAAFLAAAIAATTSVGAVPAHQPVETRDFSLSLNLADLFDGFDLSHTNNYGAPIPPWVFGAKPGWYYGPHPGDHPSLPCLGGLICKILDLIPFFIHCPHDYPLPPTDPPPTDGYTNTFHNISAAVQADDYMTFGLVETIAACKAMCDSVDGCKFANSYHDVNGKDGSPLLTCALFRECHGPEDADNEGGQSQPDGSINFIAESDGWCRQ